MRRNESEQSLRPPSGVESSPANPEIHLDQPTLLWLAGIFESGGTLHFQNLQRKNTDDVKKTFLIKPVMRVESRRTELPVALEDRFGGKLSSDKTKWELAGHVAVQIILQLEPFILSRSEIVAAVKEWLATPSRQLFAQIEISKTVVGIDRFVDLREQDYAELVAQPAFVAGILDNRGTVSAIRDGDGLFPAVQFGLTNEALILALHKRYGGSKQTATKEGDTFTVRGKEVTMVRNSYSLSMQKDKARDFLTLLEPFVTIPFFDGWKVKSSRPISPLKLEQQESIAARIDRLHKYLLNVIDQSKNNQLTKVPTLIEMTSALGVTKGTLSLDMQSIPDEVRTQWRQIGYEVNKGALSDEKVSEIILFITRELEQFTQGNISRLSSKQQLADRFKLDISTIKRRVLPRLDDSIREKRRRVLEKRIQAGARIDVGDNE